MFATYMKPPSDLCNLITEYLGNGGFFNPEMMDHDKVRNLLFDCRETLYALAKGNGTTTARSRKPTDWVLWHRPAHGPAFMLDWGTEEAMKAKLAEMVIEPPLLPEQPSQPQPEEIR